MSERLEISESPHDPVHRGRGVLHHILGSDYSGHHTRTGQSRTQGAACWRYRGVYLDLDGELFLGPLENGVFQRVAVLGSLLVELLRCGDESVLHDVGLFSVCRRGME